MRCAAQVAVTLELNPIAEFAESDTGKACNNSCSAAHCEDALALYIVQQHDGTKTANSMHHQYAELLLEYEEAHLGATRLAKSQEAPKQPSMIAWAGTNTLRRRQQPTISWNECGAVRDRCNIRSLRK